MKKFFRKYFPLCKSLFFPTALVLSLLLVQAENTSFLAFWIIKFHILLGFLILYLAYQVYLKVSLPVALLVGYFMLEGLIFGDIKMPVLRFFVNNQWGIFPQELRSSLHISFLMDTFLFVVVAGFLLTKKPRHFYKKACFWSALIAAYLLAGASFFLKDVNDPLLFLPNHSMAGCFIAILIVGQNSFWGLLILLPALLCLGALTPVGVLVGGLAARLAVSQRRDMPRYVGPSALILATWAVWAGSYKFLDGHGRYELWKQVWHWFRDQSVFVQVFGAGLGSIPIVVPRLQLINGLASDSNEFYMYLHSEPLQILVMGGVIGLALSLLVFWGALVRAKGDPKWFGMLVAYGISTLCSYPLHCPLLAWLGCVLLGGAFWEMGGEK